MSTNSEWMGTHSPLELKRVDKVQMGVMSPDFLAKLSVVKVTTAELYQANGVPKPNGLLDSRMGTLDPPILSDCLPTNALRQNNVLAVVVVVRFHGHVLA